VCPDTERTEQLGRDLGDERGAAAVEVGDLGIEEQWTRMPTARAEGAPLAYAVRSCGDRRPVSDS
jgi:hypothetical protein